nr:prepilin-type N-terminal cleavage/methylation domain-containing protein [Thioalkalivibrio paradoxus]
MSEQRCPPASGRRCPAVARGRRRQHGFSLLEAVVAFTIAAMALLVLYQSAGSALQRVGEAEAYTYALALATSLLGARDELPRGGLSAAGETEDGFAWEIRSAPLEAFGDALESPVPLHRVDVTVRWRSGFRERSVDLHSVRPEGRE